MPSPKSLSKRKVSPKNVLTKSRKNSNTTPWLKNAMRTLGQNSLEVFRDISPNIYDVVETSTKSAVSVAKEIKSGNTTRSVTDSINNNKFIKAGKTAIKNSIEDLKKGNFNNTEREDQAMAAYMGMDGDDWDDFGTFFDDWDADGGDDGTAVQINNFTDNSGTVAITDEMRRGSIAQLQGQKANIDSMIAVSSAHMLQQQEISNQILGKLDNITSSIGALIEFNNSVMQNYIDSQMAYMERMGGMVEEYTSGGGNTGVDPQSVFRDANGGINTRNYINLVKEQAQKTFKNSMVGSLNDLVDEDMLNTMVANPLQGVSKLAIKAALPKVLKNSAKQLDEAFAGFVPTLLAKLATQGDVFSFNAKDSIMNTFAKILGVRQGKESRFDLSNRFTGKVARFDDITRHSITEIIPGYLRDSTAYLRDIAKALGVNDKRSRDTARVFDYQNGQYRTMQNLKEEVMTTIDQSGIEAINRTRFGKKMRALGSFGTLGDQAAYDNALDELFRRLEENGKFIDITNMSDGSDLDEILKAGKYSPNMQNRLRAALQEINADKSLALNANAAVMKARFARNNTIKSMNEDPDRYGLYSITDNREIDKQVADVVNKTIGTPAESKKIGTVSSILSDVRYLLNRGIDVRIAGHGSYGSIDSFDTTASGTPRETIIDRAKNTINNAANQAKYRFTGEETEYYDADGNYAEDPNKRPESVAKQRERMQKELINTDEEQTKYAKIGTDFMHALVFGSGREASSVLAKAASVKFGDIGKKFNEDFLEPMKESVFGKRDERGYEREGLLSGIQNKFVDSYKEFVRQFNGKGYVDSTGKTVDPKGDDEQTVVGNLKSMVHDVKDSFMDYVFGKKDESGKRQKANTLLGKVTGAFDEGLKGWKTAIFGETDKDGNPVDINMKDITDRIKSALPATITGGMMGAAGAMSLGGSVLGTIVGGPLTGAVIGSIGGILSQSDKFKNWLFGDLGKDGERKDNGFISKGVQDFFKKNKTEIVGGAALGALKQVIFPNSAVGLLGHLVGGPLAGAILGAGVGIVKKSDFFQEFLYGKEGSWHKGIIPMFNSIFKKKDSNGEDTGETSGLKIAGMTGIGAAGGALTGALVSSMGLIPACMTPMGPIGGAVVGVAAALKASQKGIHSYLFGSDDKDKYGLKNIGVLQKFGNMLDVELFQPMKNGLANFIEDSRNFIIDKMLAPVEFAVEPMVAAFKNVADDIGNRIKSVTDSVGEYVRGKILDPIVESARKFIITPMKRTFGFFFKAFTGIAKSIISAPFTALSLLTNFNNARDKRNSRRRVMEENRNAMTGEGFLENLAIRFHYGDAYKKAGWKYSDMGEDEARQYDERKQLYFEDRNKRRAEAKQNRIDRKNSEYNRQMIARATGNKLTEDTEENRRIAQQMLNDGRRNNMIRKWGKDIKWKGDRFYDDMSDPRNQKVDSSSLTNDKLTKNADDPKSDPQNRSLGYLIKIYDKLDSIGGKKKNHNQNNNESIGTGFGFVDADGNDIDINQSIADFASGKSGKNKKNNGPKPTEESGNALLHLLVGAASTAADVPGQIDAAKEVVDRKIRGLFSNIHIPFFAKGGTAKEDGVAIVGEEGPELAYLKRGTKVIPNSKIDQGESAEASDAYEAAKKKGSYEEQQRRAKEEKKEKETKEFQDKLIENTGQAKDDQKKHFSIWNSIFSKKGIITGMAITGGLLLNKFLKKFLNIDIIGGLASTIATAFKTVLTDLGFGNKNGEDGDTLSERVDNNLQDMHDLVTTGDIADFIAPGGKLNHMSAAKANALVHLPQYGKLLAKTKIGKDLIGGTKAIGTLANRAPRYIANSGIGKAIQNGVGYAKDFYNIHQAGGIRNFAKEATSRLSSDFGGDTLSSAVNETAESWGIELAEKNTTKSTATVTGLVSKAMSAISEKLSGVISKYGGKAGSKLVDLISKFTNFCKSKIGWIADKLTKGASKVAKVVPGLMVTLGALDGATGAQRLFQTDEKPNFRMLAISTAIGALKGTTVGSILDIINELVNDVMGVDMFHELAMFVYNLIANDEDYAKLESGINDFKSKYEENKNKEIQDSYETYCAVYGISQDQFTLEDYEAAIENGTAKATTTSYADYNSEQHQTFTSKAYNAIKNSAVGSALGGAKKFIFGNKDVSYVDNENRKWVEDKTNPGHYFVYDATTGEQLGNSAIAGEYLPQDATKIDNSTKNIVFRGFNAVKNGIGTAVGTVGHGIATGAKAVGRFGSNVAHGAINVGKTAVNGVGNIVKAAGSGIIDFGGYLADAFGAITSANKQIEADFNNLDMDLKDVMTSDLTSDMDAKNPLKPIVSGVLGVYRIPAVIALWVRGVGIKIGKSVGSIFKGIFDKFVNFEKDYFSAIPGLYKTACTGDVSATINYSFADAEDSDGNPVSGFVKGVAHLDKIFAVPISLFAAAGKGIVGIFAKLIDGAKSIGSDVGSTATDLLPYVTSGDVEGLINYSPSETEDNPVSFAQTATAGVGKILLSPATMTIGIGKKIATFVKDTASKIADAGSTAVSSISDLLPYVTSGDLKGLYNATATTDDGEPAGVVASVATGVGKILLSSPTAIIGAGRSIASGVAKIFNKAVDIKTATVDYVTEAMTYLDTSKDINGLDKIKFGGNDSDPVVSVIKPIIHGIVGTFVRVVRGVKDIGGTIANLVGNGANWVKDKATGAAQAVGGFVSGIGSSVYSGASKVFSWGRGGKGGNDVNLPYYSQNDPRWKNMAYGDESMGDAGCGPDAFAMVASGLGGARGGVTPVDVAQYAESKGFRDDSGTNWNFVDSAARDYGLSSNRQQKPDSGFISSQLNQGHPIILSGQGGSGTPYTSGGHYVVATGKDSNGNVTVKDPRGPQYSGKYPMKSVVNGANVAWGMSKGGRGNKRARFTVINGGRGSSVSPESVIMVAANELGYLEKKSNMNLDDKAGNSGHNNYTKYEQDVFGTNGNYWCASFVSWCFMQAAGGDKNLAKQILCGTLSRSCNEFMSAFKNAGRFSNTPSLGDVVFFSGSRQGGANHVGIVVGFGTGTIITIEGNTSGGTGVIDNGGCVMKKEYSTSNGKILGYGHPNFNAQSSFSGLDNSGANAVDTSAYTTTSGGNSSGNSIINTLSSFFSQVASKSWDYITTGNYDNNWDFSDGSSSSTSSSNGGLYVPTTTGASDVSVGDTEKAVYKYFTSKGFSPAATYGIMGNIKQESGFNPAAIQSPSQNAAGLFQWENYKNKSNRWAMLNNIAHNKGKNWTDLNTQLDYALYEMQNDKSMWRKGAKSGLDNVTSLDQFMQMTDPGQAAIAFSNHFERPGKPMNDVRVAAAKGYMNQFNNIASSGVDSNGNVVALDSSYGGRGGDDESIPFANVTRNLPKRDKTTVIGTNINSKSLRYTGSTRGGRGDNYEKYFELIIKYLADITSNSADANTKLEMLKNIKNISISKTSVNAGGRGGESKTIVVNKPSEQIATPAPSRTESIARKLAAGF